MNESGPAARSPEELAKAAYPCHPNCAFHAYHVKRCIHAALPGLLTEFTFHVRAALAARDAAWREALVLAGIHMHPSGARGIEHAKDTAPLRALLSEGKP